MKKILVFMLLWCTFCALYAQVQCGNKLPIEYDAETLQFANLSKSYHKATGQIRTIPVVVHIIAEYQSSPDDISSAQVQSGIDVLNEAFSGQYGGVDTEIRFCLAATNRIYNLTHSTVALMVNEAFVKGLSFEDPYSYYNVWVVKELSEASGRVISGYTNYPKFLTTHSQLDGTLIPNKYWGKIGTGDDVMDFDQGKTAVHEAGHWLNLFHVFEGGCDYEWNCGGAGDCCCDTPPMAEAQFKCKRRANSCHTDSPDERDPVSNFMGYTPHDCMDKFTACQSSRMNLCLDSIRRFAWFTNGDCPTPRIATQTIPDLNFDALFFPNPFANSGTLQLDVLEEELPLQAYVLDSHGQYLKKLHPVEGFIGKNQYKIQLSLPVGIYFVRIVSSYSSRTLKIISIGN